MKDNQARSFVGFCPRLDEPSFEPSSLRASACDRSSSIKKMLKAAIMRPKSWKLRPLEREPGKIRGCRKFESEINLMAGHGNQQKMAKLGGREL